MTSVAIRPEKRLNKRRVEVAPTPQGGGQSLALVLGDELLDALTEAVRARLADELEAASPWLTRSQAAEYLQVPVSRLEKDRTVPCHRWEGRVLYLRSELDDFILGFGGGS
jgi:hypothetical protein